MSNDITFRKKVSAIFYVVKYRPMFTLGIIGLSVFAAFMEGIGLSFILPIVEHSRGTIGSDPGGLIGMFIRFYEILGLPFTLEYIILGVGFVMTIRYVSSFSVAWLRAYLQTDYVRYLRRRSYEGAVNASVEYFDERGSDDILNAIITQTTYSGNAIQHLVTFLQVGLLTLVYLSIAMIMAPGLTLAAMAIIGVAVVISRRGFESGFVVGGRVAEANERIQRAVQAGTQNIRDVKLFSMADELIADFQEAKDRWTRASVKERRNSAGIQNFHQLTAALSVFALIYLALEYASLSLGSLGVFLFAMFRLSPRMSSLNNTFYSIETSLSHLLRSVEFIDEVEAQVEDGGEMPAPTPVEQITFENVSFAYETSSQVLQNVSFQAQAGEFIAFVGQSGAGKSTIVSLLARMYDPSSGEIRANGTSIDEFDLESWRSRLAVVRQQPAIFNRSLRFNLTIGNREASQEEIERVVDIARVDEFIDDLPRGYDTLLGDDGVRLSGGQKQRVALARALLKNADILVLDEATSDLDTNIEEEVHNAIESINDEYITILIAHRLSTVTSADRIYTLVDGAITDVGRHEELLRLDGKYAELYATSRTTSTD